MLAHLGLRQVYAIPRKPQAFAIQSKMASGLAFATVGTTKFDLFISTLSCQNVLHVSVQNYLQFLIKERYTLNNSPICASNLKDSLDWCISHSIHETRTHMIIIQH